MEILAFIRGASRRQLGLMLALTLIAGVANAFLVVAVTVVGGQVAQGQRPGLLLWLGFAAAFLLYYLCNKYALMRATAAIEALLNRLRLQVVDKLRRSELQTVNRLGRGRLYALVATETNHLSVTFPLLVDAFQQSVLLAVALLYLLYLSPAAFGVFALSVLVGLLSYKTIDRRFRDLQVLLGRMQGRMLDVVADIIHGGKELRLNSRRGEAVERASRKLSFSVEAMLIRAGEHWAALILLGSLVTYLMLGVVGFTFPPYVGGYSVIVFELLPVLLFCMGALTKIVAQSPMFLRAEVGLQAIMEVERELSAAVGIDPEAAWEAAPAFRDFREIAYDGIAFTYRSPAGEETYRVGPLDLAVRRGEVIFLVGGNGSGKSTALRMMTGLFACEAGEIRVDGRALSQAGSGGRGLAGFRELFSAIFVDFHLFDRLYGLEEADPAEVERLISEMGLAGKVRFEDGRFSRLHLSTGQRKRLALIAALLEDRPVYVFDEWSAEQDAAFRQYFYETVIPGLRARGKLVIAATHDERYHHVADRVVKLDLGRIEWVRGQAELEME